MLRLQTLEMEMMRIAIRQNLPYGALVINLDSEMIGQVLINLIKNARKAIGSNRSDGLLVIHLEVQSTEIVLHITDNGSVDA